MNFNINNNSDNNNTQTKNNTRTPNFYAQILNNKKAEEDLKPTKMEVNAETFFTDSCEQGQVSKHDFLDFVHSLTEYELKMLDKLFDLMNQKQRFTVTPFENVDKKGRSYIWIDLKRANTDTGFKVLTVGKLWHLVNLYGFNLVNCDLTVEALYLKATA